MIAKVLEAVHRRGEQKGLVMDTIEAHRSDIEI
jgi:hypothetical protein